MVLTIETLLLTLSLYALRVPEITLLSQGLLLGSAASVSVTATSPVSLTYQWRKDGLLLPDGTSPTLTISAVRAVDAGTYDVVATNATGASVSESIRLGCRPSTKIRTTSGTRAIREAMLVFIR